MTHAHSLTFLDSCSGLGHMPLHKVSHASIAARRMLNCAGSSLPLGLYHLVSFGTVGANNCFGKTDEGKMSCDDGESNTGLFRGRELFYH